MTSSIRLVLIALLFTSSAQSAEPAPGDPLQFGALRFGMSANEARAALPDAVWTVVDQHPTTQRLYSLKGEDAVTIADVPFDAYIGSRYGGTMSWVFGAEVGAANAAACHERMVLAAVELERRFGTFDSPGQLVPGQALIRFGMTSRARATAASKSGPLDPQRALREGAQQYVLRSRHNRGDGPADVAVDFSARYERDGLTPCSIRISLEGREPVPEGLQSAIRKARWARVPTIAYRNRTLRALGVPNPPLKFVMKCRVSADNGRVGSCLPGGEDRYRALAAQWGLDFQLAVENGQEDDYRFFDVDVPITMGPDDIRTVDVSTGPRLELAQIQVIRGTQINVDEFYTDEMRKLKSGADVTILCKVQEDGSVLCDLEPGAIAAAKPFVDAAIAIGERLEVKTVLRDGTPAVGGLMRRTVKFAPP